MTVEGDVGSASSPLGATPMNWVLPQGLSQASCLYWAFSFLLAMLALVLANWWWAALQDARSMAQGGWALALLGLGLGGWAVLLYRWLRDVARGGCFTLHWVPHQVEGAAGGWRVLGHPAEVCRVLDWSAGLLLKVVWMDDDGRRQTIWSVCPDHVVAQADDVDGWMAPLQLRVMVNGVARRLSSKHQRDQTKAFSADQSLIVPEVASSHLGLQTKQASFRRGVSKNMRGQDDGFPDTEPMLQGRP